MDEAALRNTLDQWGQGHVLRFWDELDAQARVSFAQQISEINFPLVEKLIDAWVLNEPAPSETGTIEPVKVVSPAEHGNLEADAAWEAGEEALRAGRVGLVLVAGGQGTRLGFNGPKGTYPIGPITGRTLFEYTADRILSAQRRYDCSLPWYIMVGETNEADTIAFFQKHAFFGLGEENVTFFKQSMMPCVTDAGKFLLESKGSLAMNPNGHGGSIPAMADSGILQDARNRGIDTLSYFQVDNWAAQITDPFFIGYHLQNDGELSSKAKRKLDPHEASGVFCLVNGRVQVIEYTELDIYPQLLDTDTKGELLHFAANAATHMISVDFVERVHAAFEQFPWHCSHKKVAHLDNEGSIVEPDTPNAYKFETFVFDALAYCQREALILEIPRLGEFAPAKQLTGPGGVDEAQASMAEYWRGWLEAAGCTTPLEGAQIEINPQFANTKEEFVANAARLTWPASGDIAIDADGAFH